MDGRPSSISRKMCPCFGLELPTEWPLYLLLKTAGCSDGETITSMPDRGCERRGRDRWENGQFWQPGLLSNSSWHSGPCVSPIPASGWQAVCEGTLRLLYRTFSTQSSSLTACAKISGQTLNHPPSSSSLWLTPQTASCPLFAAWFPPHSFVF